MWRLATTTRVVTTVATPWATDMPKYMRFPARSYAGIPTTTTATRESKERRLAGAGEDDVDSVDHMHPGSILMEGRSGTTIWMRYCALQAWMMTAASPRREPATSGLRGREADVV